MEALGAIAIVAVLIWVGVQMLAGARSDSPASAGAATPHLRGSGSFDMEVVGESNYEAAFERLLGAKAGTKEEVRKDAVLLLENDNRHDDQAVRVSIDGHTVGYLSRSMARVFRRSVAGAGAGQFKHFTCAAQIYCGGAKRQFSVRLDLDYRE